MNDNLSRVDERRAQRGCNEKWPRDAHSALSRYGRMDEIYGWCMVDENIDDWIYGCMGSAVTDFNFKFLREDALAITFGYWSDEATYGWLTQFSSRWLHIPPSSPRSHPILMMFWDISGYSSAEFILRNISFSDFRITNHWRIARLKIAGYSMDGWGKEVLDEHLWTRAFTKIILWGTVGPQ